MPTASNGAQSRGKATQRRRIQAGHRPAVDVDAIAHRIATVHAFAREAEALVQRLGATVVGVHVELDAQQPQPVVRVVAQRLHQQPADAAPVPIRVHVDAQRHRVALARRGAARMQSGRADHLAIALRHDLHMRAAGGAALGQTRLPLSRAGPGHLQQVRINLGMRHHACIGLGVGDAGAAHARAQRAGRGSLGKILWSAHEQLLVGVPGSAAAKSKRPAGGGPFAERSWGSKLRAVRARTSRWQAVDAMHRRHGDD